MGIIPFARPGSWSLQSKIDPRWNCNGRSEFVGGFVTPTEAEEKIEELKKEYGVPPSDLEIHCYKD